MKLNKFFKGAAATACILSMTGCASDYLDTPYHDVIPAEDICKTTETARLAVLGVCGRGMAAPWSVGNMFPAQALMQGETGVSYYMGEIPGSDNFVNFILDSAPSWAVYYNMNEGNLSSGGYVWNTTTWTYAYALIAQLNEILATIDNAEGPDADRNFTKAQALTLRAHCYWRLLQVYAPRWEDSNNGEKLTVVLRELPGEPQNKAVTTMNDILALCYNDLDTAIECFNNASGVKRQLHFEPTLNIAYGVYARVAALKHDWEKVRTMAHNARQGYRIATHDEIFNGYLQFNENEWMWSPSFAEIDNFIYGNWCTFFACNGTGANDHRYTNRINIDLYNQIPEGDERRDWFLTSEKLDGTVPMMFYSSFAVNPTTLTFNLETLVNASRTWLDAHKPANCTGNNAYQGSGSGDSATALIVNGAQVKFWCNGETGQNGVCQIPYMRATEMYLYEAEACAELGMTAEAQNLLNEVNQPRNPSYNCTSTGTDLLNEVRTYRRIELWGEGFCWFDLKRWNMNMTRRAWVENDITSGNIPSGIECNVAPSSNNGWRFGIPLSERNRNNFIVEPIPGELVVVPKD